MAPKRRCTISDIEETGSDGFNRAFLDLDGHMHAIEVIGKSLDECIDRASEVKTAFNNKEESK